MELIKKELQRNGIQVVDTSQKKKKDSGASGLYVLGRGGGATMGHRDKVFAAWRQCRASGPSCRFLLA